MQKYTAAFYVWERDIIAKDRTGLFSTTPPSPPMNQNVATFTLPQYAYPYPYSYVVTGVNTEGVGSIASPQKSLKCECGSDSVNSNVHSNYCPKGA